MGLLHLPLLHAKAFVHGEGPQLKENAFDWQEVPNSVLASPVKGSRLEGEVWKTLVWLDLEELLPICIDETGAGGPRVPIPWKVAGYIPLLKGAVQPSTSQTEFSLLLSPFLNNVTPQLL